MQRLLTSSNRCERKVVCHSWRYQQADRACMQEVYRGAERGISTPSRILQVSRTALRTLACIFEHSA